MILQHSRHRVRDAANAKLNAGPLPHQFDDVAPDLLIDLIRRVLRKFREGLGMLDDGVHLGDVQ